MENTPEQTHQPVTIERLPGEILILIMLNLGDLEDLQCLVEAFPYMSGLTESYFKTLIPPLVEKSLVPVISWPDSVRPDSNNEHILKRQKELERLLYAILSPSRARDSFRNSDEFLLFREWLPTQFRLAQSAGSLPPLDIPRTKASVAYMAKILRSVKFLLETYPIPLVIARGYGFSKYETFRSLLSYQLVYELSRPPRRFRGRNTHGNQPRTIPAIVLENGLFDTLRMGICREYLLESLTDLNDFLNWESRGEESARYDVWGPHLEEDPLPREPLQIMFVSNYLRFSLLRR